MKKQKLFYFGSHNLARRAIVIPNKYQIISCVVDFFLLLRCFKQQAVRLHHLVSTFIFKSKKSITTFVIIAP